MQSKNLTMQILILFLLSSLLLAQKDNSLNEKLNNIKGNVNKIVISTDKGDITFEGEEGKKLFKKMKANKMKKLKWISESDSNIEIDGENIMIFKSDDGDKHIIKEIKDVDNVLIMKHGDHEDFDIIEGAKTIRVEVEDENGEKKITVTTKEDGEEKLEVFEGKEADEYLKKMEEENDMIIDVDYEFDSDSKSVWVHKLGDKNSIEKDVKVEIEDGVKKVTVTTMENGEEKVEVFEGDDADEYFESADGEKIHVKVKKIKDVKNEKKIIIKEKKNKNED